MKPLSTLFRSRRAPLPTSAQLEREYGPLRDGLPAVLAQSAPAAPPALVQPKVADFTPVLWGGRRLDPAQVRTILQNAAQGSLQDQWELFSLMEDTWPRLMKNLNEVRRAAARTTYAVQPYAERGAEPTATAQARADLAEAALKNWRPRPGTLELGFEDALYHGLDALGKGTAVLEVSWQRQAESILPRCAHLLSPRSYGWNEAGNELGLLSRADWQPFPAGQFLVGIWHSRSGAPGATALLRALAPYWVGITFGWEWLLATAQIFGVPFRWATYDPTRPELLGTLLSMLQQMGTAGYAAFPAGTTLDFKDAAMRSADNPQVLIQTLADKACDLLILGQEASSESKPAGLGNGASDLHGTVRREVLHAAAQWCADLLNYQLVPALLRWNWGDEAELPTIVPDLAGDPDPVQLAQRDQVLSTIPGVKFVAKAFYERHGLSVPQAGEETLGGIPATNFPPVGGPSLGTSAPGGDSQRSPASGDSADLAEEGADKPESDEGAGGAVKARSANPPRSAVASSGGSKALPGAYPLPPAARAALAAAHARDFAPLRQAAAPLLAAIESGNLEVVGKLEAFIAELDTLAPQMAGASELADALEAALAEAAIGGAAQTYRKLETTQP